MQIHEYSMKTTETTARGCVGFKFRSFKYFARIHRMITKMASSLEASST
jgi:hypothetical protein